MNLIDAAFVGTIIGGGGLYWWLFAKGKLAKPQSFTLPTEGGRFLTRNGRATTIEPALIYGDFLVTIDGTDTSYVCDKYGKARHSGDSGYDIVQPITNLDEPFKGHRDNGLVP